MSEAPRTAADARRVLHDRARVLARSASTTDPAPGLEILAFRIDGEPYAVESAYVSEVHALRELAPLPCVPAFVAGIINIRGRVVPVLDLRVRFGLVARGRAREGRAGGQVIVAAARDVEVALLADCIEGTWRVAAAGADPGVAVGAVPAAFVRAWAERRLVLDLQALLADPGLLVEDEAD